MKRYVVLCMVVFLSLAACTAFAPRRIVSSPGVAKNKEVKTVDSQSAEKEFYNFERTIVFTEMVKGKGASVIIIFKSGKISGLNHREPLDFKDGDEIVWNSAKVGWGEKSTARRAMTTDKVGKLFTGIGVPQEDTGYFSLHRKAENDYLSFRMTEWKYSENVSIDRKKWLLSYKVKQ